MAQCSGATLSGGRRAPVATLPHNRAMSSSECWLLTDGAAGNLQQARALAHGLGVAAEPIDLHPRAPWRWLAPRLLAGAGQAWGTEFARRLHQPPALAIGCGRQGALAARLLRQRHGGRCRSVQILDPRIDPAAFDAVVAPLHDGLAGANVVHCLGSLTAIDAEWLQQARQRSAALATLPQPLTLLSVGGPTARMAMTPRWFAALAAVLEHWLERDGGSLLVSTSRRTPAWLRSALRHRFAGVAGRQWHGPADGENPYPGFLAHATRIVVSADSSNLLSEAAAVGVPVLVHGSARGKLALLYRELLQRGHVRPLTRDYQPWTVEPLRELPRVAAQVNALLQRR